MSIVLSLIDFCEVNDSAIVGPTGLSFRVMEHVQCKAHLILSVNYSFNSRIVKKYILKDLLQSKPF